MAVSWPTMKIAGKRIPYVPVTLIFVMLEVLKKKNKKSLTEEDSHEKI